MDRRLYEEGGRQTDRQTDRPTDRQTDRQTFLVRIEHNRAAFVYF